MKYLCRKPGKFNLQNVFILLLRTINNSLLLTENICTLFVNFNNINLTAKTMKKLLFSALLAFGFMLYVGAQSFELYHEGVLLPQGSVITIDGEPTAAEIIVEVSVKNVSTTAKNVKCRKIEVELIPNTFNYFCWGLCYGGNVYVSPYFLNIGAGQTNDEFSGHYQPSGNAGITRMCYSFFDDANPSDSTYFYTDFFASLVGVESVAKNEVSFSDPYPNPASGNVSIKYSLPAGVNAATIKIHNLLGSVVKETTLVDDSGKITFDVSDLNEGIYFSSIAVNGETFQTKRLIVSR